MTASKLPDEFLSLLAGVTGKRARVVIDHILKHGAITTEDLKQVYGYDHPPRAIRDVREQGIPIETFTVKNSAGRSSAAYRFGDPSLARGGILGGRTVFPRLLKHQLVEKHGKQCMICAADLDARYLQIDHRVPYEVAGETHFANLPVDDFMLLCASCNRAKSWSCEHCRNWKEIRSPAICKKCYWANPVSYSHVAMNDIRRLDVTWIGKEVSQYEALRKMAKAEELPMPLYVRKILAKLFKK